MRRPDGRVLLFLAGSMIVVGLIFGLACLKLGIGSDPSAWGLLFVSAAFFNGGFALWALGLVLRALWFLPGREVDDAELGSLQNSPTTFPEVVIGGAVFFGGLIAAFVLYTAFNPPGSPSESEAEGMAAKLEAQANELEAMSGNLVLGSER